MTFQTLLGPNGLMFSTEDENKNVQVYWGGLLYYSFNRDDLFAKKLGIALLSSIGVLQKTICELFRVSRHTIANILEIYKEQGTEGLNDYKPGPNSTSDELKQFVINKFVELEGSYGYQNKILEAVNQKVEEGDFEKGISRSMMQRIFKEYREERERRREENVEKQAAEKVEKKGHKELEENVSSDKGSWGDDEQIEFIEELGEGEQRCVEHGGCSVVLPFLDDYGMADYIPPDGEDYRFSNTELAVTYAILNAAEIAKVEQDFKLLPSYEMGGMLGRGKLPSVSLYRKRIPLIAAQMDMREVILESSKRMHELLNFSEVVYIDGHFMPYHGARDILHGYYPQKRLAMHGREYFFVHERDGLPVYATISDGYRKTKHYIKDVDEKLRAIYGVRKKGLLEVFDRGGYSKEFCVGISDTIRFICWRSDAKGVPKEIEAAEWVELRVEHQGNNFGQVKEKKLYACERKAEFEVEGEKATFREIWIRKGRKTSPALSNDFETSLGDLVRHMTRRWGAQENMFKELKKHGIDRIHSYRKEAFTEGFLYEQGLEDRARGIVHEIDNPERRTINKRISNLRVQKRRLSDRIIELEKKGKKKEALKIKRKHQGLSSQIKNQTEKRDVLPKKVNLFERIKQKGIVRLSDEKKLFFDWLKMNAIWTKREIVEIVKPFYKDLRDVNKFVKSILNSRTYVRKSGEVLYVTFPPQRSKKAAKALEQLCATLNEHNYIDLGLSMIRLIFSVRGQD